MLFDFPLKAALPDEKALFYSGTSEILPRIGYIRADFGSSGEEFWHSWYPGEAAVYSLEGQTLEEIGKKMHMTPNALWVRLFRIRKRIQKYFK